MALGANGKQMSEEEWRAVVSPEQFRILRLKGTELPGPGEYNKFYGDGVYNCAVCRTPLYKSTPNLILVVASLHSLRVFQEP